MEKEMRQLILDKSRELFVQQGYSDTSMRQIAAACGIKVGNLCYYFKKKEELLMAYHDHLYSSLIAHLPEGLSAMDPWCSYIAMEYCFLYKCAKHSAIRKLYLNAINVPSLRKAYIEKHHEVFLSFFAPEQLQTDSHHAFITTAIVSSTEFQMMEQYDLKVSECDFDQAFSYVFDVRMNLLDIPKAEQKYYRDMGFTTGKKIISDHPFLMDS